MSEGAPDGDRLPDRGVESLVDDLDALAADAEGVGAEVAETKRLLSALGDRGVIDSGVRHLQARDVAEALVGAVIFASPLLVEDGIYDIGLHLFEDTVAGYPVYLVANTAFVVFMTYALVEWTGRDRTEANRWLELVRGRVAMTLAVSFVVSAVLLTVWGRVTWARPIEALARVNVLWTVGSIGAALGDVISVGEPPGGTDGVAADSDAALVEELHEQFADLERAVSGTEHDEAVERLRDRATSAAVDDLFGDRIGKYTTRDLAESFVGSVVFSIPFLVEDGVSVVADHFLSFRLGQFPVFFLLNAGFVLLMVMALVYWTGPQDVHVSRPLFGVLPRRLVGVSVVSFLTAAALMTLWGRVAGWHDPVAGVARVSVVWTVASFGAALGDILPGESSGDDINDDLADLGEQLEDLVDGTD